MRFKDIEKSLKREQNQSSVPDVYMRVKKAPINKLLEGETPALAFQKQMAMRLLIGTAVIFMVAVIAFSAMWFSRSSALDLPDYYVSIVVERDDGEEARYGAVLHDDTGTVFITEESAAGETDKKHSLNECLQINDFIMINSTDKVSISIIGKDYRSAFLVASDMSVRLNEACGAATFITVNDRSAKIAWKDYIVGCGGIATSEDDFSKLMAAYLSLFD